MNSPPNIFCGSRVFTVLFCPKVKAANAILNVAKNWSDNFPDFIDLQGKKQVWQILPNFTEVAVPIKYSWELSDFF